MSLVKLKEKKAKIDQSKVATSGKKFEIISSNIRATPTILSKDLSIEGDINSSGTIEIEGKVYGNITGSSVILREGSYVNGAIFAKNLNIRGNFEGKIKANSLSISSKADVVGTVEYGSLSVEDGASIDGQFKKVISKSSQD
jgi:cytoskeletal protein CcmA (bactofilin family)